MNNSEWALIFQLKPQICNQGVAGSNPAAGTKLKKKNFRVCRAQKIARKVVG
jgi:hypothetical protein